MGFPGELRIVLAVLGLFLFLLSACRYQRGDRYSATTTGDKLTYLILDRGRGAGLSQKAARLKLQHEYRGNDCQIRYVTDSADFSARKGLLLMNTSLPNIQEDILTKGYIGSLTSKQNVVYVLVSYPDLKQFFRKTGRNE